ncbi:MAG: ABC transporter permease/substrate-binding protein, partial [Bdellovibrionota bacterium]|nr:ABC transporter permease/substrate-binding protein [Bdellovibrionota bacterium]
MKEQLEMLWSLFYAHLSLSLVALFIGTAISIPLGIWVSHRKKWRKIVLGFSGVIQTIPGLALLAIMVPLLDFTSRFFAHYLNFKFSSIGYLPALLALILYSLLPILRNTVTGILGVDRELIEAAEAVGMTPRQRLFKVELIMALPVIFAGLRTATIWVIGLTTLATPVGAPSLGNLIFSGLQTKNYPAVFGGCIAAAILAIFFDSLMGKIESSWRKRQFGLLKAIIVFLTLLYGVIFFNSLKELFADNDNKVIIGTKSFTEQYILGDILKKMIQGKTSMEVDLRKSLGSNLLFDALKNDQIDIYISYSGTVWSSLMKRKDIPSSSEKLLSEVRSFIEKEHNAKVASFLGFENKYAFAMARSKAEKLGIKNVSDLKNHSLRLKLGTDYVFLDRLEWKNIKKLYTIDFRKKIVMDPTLMYDSVNKGEVDIITAYTSDGRIKKYDL